MQNYLQLLQKVLEEGHSREDRTQTGTLSLFGEQLRFDLTKGLPLVTTKKVHFKSIVYELLWFLKGDTNLKYLHDHNVTIWDEWADEKGDLGPIYGEQWRRWKGAEGEEIDQISQVIEGIKKNPFSRRHLVSSWNVGMLSKISKAPPPCHSLFQFYVQGDSLSCQLYQRSADIFLGVPFNIASYALLCHMVAHVCHLHPKEFVHTFGDIHLYKNHVEQAKIQLNRKPKPLPLLELNPEKKDIFSFVFEDICLKNYEPDSPIKAPVAI